MKYEKRVVAFIDILGFKALLDETTNSSGEDDEKKIDHVISAYKAIRDTLEIDTAISGLNSFTSKRVSIFSDSIVVSFKVEEPSEVFSTLLDIKHLIMRLIYRNILCRGAVSIGKFIHTDDYLFGPALVEAHTLESKAAMYPRIILDRDIIEVGYKNGPAHHSPGEEKKYIESLVKQDSDGMFYIDYFFNAQSELDDPDYDFPEYIETLESIIRNGLSHDGKADLRVKYSWMRERYNQMIEIVTDRRVLDNLKSTGVPDLLEFYKDLKKISP